MSLKRFTLIFALFALFAAAVGASDHRGPKGFAVVGFWHDGPGFALAEPLILEATGLEAEALRDALLDGKTINQLIEANEGDAAATIADLALQAADAMNARAAATIESLDERLAEALNEPYRRRFPWWRRPNPLRETFRAWGMHDAIVEATGLDEAVLNEALLGGSTITDLITANDGDVAAVVSALARQATDAINEAAAGHISRVEETLPKAFDRDFSDEWRRARGWPPRRHGFFSFWSMRHDNSPMPAETVESDETAESISSVEG